MLVQTRPTGQAPSPALPRSPTCRREVAPECSSSFSGRSNSGPFTWPPPEKEGHTEIALTLELREKQMGRDNPKHFQDQQPQRSIRSIHRGYEGHPDTLSLSVLRGQPESCLVSPSWFPSSSAHPAFPPGSAGQVDQVNVPTGPLTACPGPALGHALFVVTSS